MDIKNVGGGGGIEPGGKQTRRAEQKPSEPTFVIPRDEARISPSSRDTAAAVDALVARSRRDDGEREAKVAAARAKLLAGELDDPTALRGAAGRLFANGYLGV